MPYPTYYPNYGGYAPQAPYGPQSAFYGQQMQTPAQTVQASPAQSQPSQGLSPASRLVSGREEAIAVPADFGGSLMIFPDITHNRIYLKHWNMQTGAADFIEFAPVVSDVQETPEAPAVSYVTAEELQEIRDSLEELYDELSRLKDKRKVVKRVEPDDE